MITSQKIADVLNNLLATDPQATYFLLCAMAPANAALVDHPTICVDEPTKHSGYIVRWLGVLQAIGDIDGHKIVAHYGDGKDGDPRGLIRFEALPIAKFNELCEEKSGQ